MIGRTKCPCDMSGRNWCPDHDGCVVCGAEPMPDDHHCADCAACDDCQGTGCDTCNHFGNISGRDPLRPDLLETLRSECQRRFQNGDRLSHVTIWALGTYAQLTPAMRDIMIQAWDEHCGWKP